MWSVIGVPKHRPVVTTVGVTPSCFSESYVAMHSGCVTSVMNTSAVSAPEFWIADCTSAAVPPGSLTWMPVTWMPALSSTGFNNTEYAPWADALSPYITATFFGFGCTCVGHVLRHAGRHADRSGEQGVAGRAS